MSAVDKGLGLVKPLIGGAQKASKPTQSILGVPAQPAATDLMGLFKPETAPVRGQTSKELLRQQRAVLTEQQKDILNDLREKYPAFSNAVKFMTPQEVSKIIKSESGVKEFSQLLDVLPRAKQLAAVAKAGSAKKGWYRASTQALMDVFGDDAPRFAALLAALSPQTSVEMNLINTLNTWKNWTAAGRPTGADDIRKIMGQSVAGTKGDDSVLEAWANNASRALSSNDLSKLTLSGPKVDSFYRNLADDVYRVTNDAWMASGLGVDQGLFSGSPTALQLSRGDPGLTPGYIATSARMREAGQMGNMFPSEAQETTWSYFMPLYEMQAETGMPAREILQRGLLDESRIRGTPDFSSLLRVPKYGDILESAGYGERLGGLKAYQWPQLSIDLSLPEQRELERVARRLEGLKEGRERESRAKIFQVPKGDPESGFLFATSEYIPGRGTGHLENLIDAPLGTRKNFTGRASNAFRDIQGRDILQTALGLDTIRARPMTGAFRPPGEIPFAGGRLGGESVSGRLPLEIQPGISSGAEVPITKDLDIPAREKMKATAAESLRGAMTAQHGSPWNLQIPFEEGESFVVPLAKKADEERMGMAAALQGPETYLADTGSGVVVGNFGDKFTGTQRQNISDMFGGATPIQTKSVGEYVDYSKEWKRPPGSGAVTTKMFGNLSGLSAAEREALSEAARQPAGDLYDLYQLTSRTKKAPVREDLMNLLTILRDKGLPGLAAALAAGEALPAQEPKKKTGGLAYLPYGAAARKAL